MGTTSIGSPSDLNHFLQYHDDAKLLCITHPAPWPIGEAVVGEARRLADLGRTVRLVAADAVEAARLRRLAARANLSPDAVIGLRQLALIVIEGAGKASTRGPRVLSANEIDVLMEDLKVSGLKPGRLREMTKFFYKGIADGCSDDPSWLISVEEQRIFAILTENLEARRALLPVEACAIARHDLGTPGGRAAADAALGAGAVLMVPAFSTLSATAQGFVRELGAARLVATGLDVDISNSEEDYPHPEGFEALAAEADAHGVIEAADAGPETQIIETRCPFDEFDAVADAVRKALDGGTPPEEVLVACPNRIWMDAVADRLRAADIPCAVRDFPRKVKGDPREETRCGALRTAAVARLLLDENDGAALRSWLGFGDWLLRSDAFLELLAWAREHAMTPLEAYRHLCALPEAARGTEAFSKFDRPACALAELLDGLASASGREACALMEAAGLALSPAARAAAGDEGPFDRAAFAAAVLKENDPSDEGPEPAVTIVPYRRAWGHHGSHTIICGMIGGFLPALDALSDRETVDHRRRAYDRDRLLFEAVRSTATAKLTLTYFTDDRIENADVLSMSVKRIYMRDGLRYAAVEPSPYLTDNGPVPSLPRVQTMLGVATL